MSNAIRMTAVFCTVHLEEGRDFAHAPPTAKFI